MRLFKKIDVLIYFEHVSRELDSCMKLKLELSKLNLSSEIAPIHRNRYINTVKYYPHIIVMPFLFANENDRTLEYFKRCYGNDVLCLNLHHEQFYNESTKSHFMPQNDISRLAYHIAWTKKFSEDLVEAGVQPLHINVTGNPRTDNFFFPNNNEIKTLKSSYSRLIFIPTSFSWALVDEKYFIEGAKIDPVKFRQQKDITVKTIPIFFKTIRAMARKFPNYCFVLRPHPFEDIEKYTYLLQQVYKDEIEGNIVVTREYNVYDWLKETNLMIGWFTTVSMEASLFGVKNIIFQPVCLPAFMQMEFISLYSKIYTTEQEIESILTNLDYFVQDNPALNDYIINSMGIADGNVNKRIASWINHLLKTRTTSKCYSAIAVMLYKSITVDIPKNILIEVGGIKRYNSFFSGLEEDLLSNKEIKNRYKQFNVSR